MVKLEAVVQQLKAERRRVENKLQHLEQAIRSLTKVVGENPGTGWGRKRKMSAAARKRIAAAQKARWEKFRANAARRAA